MKVQRTEQRTEQQTEKRLPYEKPVIRSVSLVADQVLGTGCKTSSGPGLGNPTCAVLPCFENGS